MATWSIELSEFDIVYEPRKALKSQMLADFVSEFSSPGQGLDPLKWTIYVDGSCSKKGAGAGVILENQEGTTIEYSLKFEFPTSNNQAEYEAVLAAIRMVKEFGASSVHLMSDSQLVVSQVKGDYQAREPILQKYLEKVLELVSGLDKFEITHIPRESNARADILSKLASTKGSENNKSLVQETVFQPSVIMAISLSPDWMKPIVAYLVDGTLPTDAMEAKKVVSRSAHYTMINGILYKRGFGSPMMRCVDPAQAETILEEIHGGVSGHHMGGRSLARKTLRAGYYWPTLMADAMDHVKRCQACQLHGDLYQRPPEELHSLNAPWPFYQWGMDIIGKFPRAPGQLQYVILAVDYFSKWVEAAPLATITSDRIQKWFVREIIARFGIPHSLVTDNGTQFTAQSFQQLAADFRIKHLYSSVEHPQTNGQAEAANKMVIEGIKKRLTEAGRHWAEQLPIVLWSYRTTIHSTTKETPFRLAFGSDAVIPIERRVPTFRTEGGITEGNDQLLSENLVLLEEIRGAAAEAEQKAKRGQAKEYNRKVNPRSFDEGSLVLRRADIGLKNAAEGKLARNWEGPYRVKSRTNSGSYRLETLGGTEIPNSWNAAKLKMYFS